MPIQITVQDQVTLILSDTPPTFINADAGGHTYLNGPGREAHIIIQNASLASITATFVSVRKSNFGTFPNKVITIGPDRESTLPLFDHRRFTDEDTLLASFTLSAITNVMVAAILPGVFFKET